MYLFRSSTGATRGKTKTNHRLGMQLVAIYAVFTAVIITVSVTMVGELIYSLDDAYIHLAVAESILRGGYGINIEEYSSPSSTIVFPLLLTVTEISGLGPSGPLILGVAAAGLGVYVGGLFLDKYVFQAGKGGSFKLAVGVVTIFAMSAVALPMTGMEHSLHVLCVVAVLYGVAAMAKENDVPWWLWLAIVSLPLVRFEGLAMALAAIAAAWLLGHRREAAICLTLIAGALAAYTAVMHQLGLPVLPSSVMAKSSLAAMAAGDPVPGGIIAMMAKNLVDTFGDRQGAFLMLLLSIIGIGVSLAWRTEDRRAAATMAAVTGFSLAAHSVAGDYGWFHRYEVYAVTAAVLTMLFVWRLSLQALVHTAHWTTKATVVIAMAVSVVPYVDATRLTPAASRGIYEQHYQMHRFVTNYYRKAVAVNDIGWVSYRNDSYVLDFWGLASEEVRRLRSSGGLKADDLAQLVARHHVELIIVYAELFDGSLPSSWRRIATMQMEPVTAHSGTVSFFTPGDIDAGSIKTALRQFKQTLPARVALTIETRQNE